MRRRRRCPQWVPDEMLARCRGERIEPRAPARIERIVRSALHASEEALATAREKERGGRGAAVRTCDIVNPEMVFAGVILALGALAILAVGVLAQAGRLPRNRWSGIRTRTTLQSDRHWRAAHRTGAPLVIVGGLAWMGAAIGLALDEIAVYAALFALGVICVFAAGLLGQRAARKLD